MRRVLAGAAMALSTVTLLAPHLGNGSPSAATVRYVAVDGSDTRQCTRSAPCASFNRAWQLAQPGDVVEIAGGTYRGQMLSPLPKSGSSLVVFRPAPGARVTVDGDFMTGSRTENAGAKHFELRGLKLTGFVSLAWGAEDVTLRDLDAPGFDLNSARNVRILGGDWGPTVDGYNSINSCGPPGCFASEDILIDGAVVHDYLLSAYGAGPADIHMQCLQIWPGRRVTIRNSTFRNCTDFGVLVDPYNTAIAGLPGDIVFENNFFDTPMPGDTATVECSPNCPRGGSAVSLEERDGWRGAKFRYNSSLGELQVDPGVQNIIMKGNVGPRRERFFCGGSNIVYSFNVWSGTKCSPSDRVAALSTVFFNSSSPGFDLRLKPGSRAVGAGDSQDHPKRDIDGRLRPATFAPDAGAWQREPALVVPGRSVGTARIGMRRADVAAFYGKRTGHGTEKSPTGERFDVDEYRVRGGKLRVTFRDGSTIAIATTSRYYQTARGLGPGTPLRPRANDNRTCRPAGNARLFLRPTRSKKPVVAELIVVAAKVKPACATAALRG